MKKSICIKKSHRRIPVPLNDILFFEKDKRKIIAHTINEDIVFYSKFDDIKMYLDERFTHPHRSYVLNMDYILSIGQSEIVFENGIKIGMGKKCIKKCKKSFEDYVNKTVAKP